MSGIEIAGLVLGAVPIIISAVDLLQDSYERTLIPFRKRRHVSMLANALLLQRQTIAETIRLLIVHSGCVYHDDGAQSQLDDDPIGYLKDEYVQDQILDFLGEKNNAALTGALQESHDILKRVARQLVGLVPTRQDRPDDLLGIIEANKVAKRQQADITSRVKLMLRSSEIKKSIEDLDAATSSLYRFSRLVLMNRSGSPSADSSRKAARLAKALRQIRGFATDLYAALCRCCQGTICHTKHEANLFLENRVDAVDEILRPAHGQERDDASVLHELPIQVLKKDEHDTSADLESAPSRVRLVVPKVMRPEEVTSAPNKAGLTLVEDFCATIAAAKYGNQPVAFVLSGSSQMGTIVTGEETILSQDRANRITLKAILSDSASIPYGVGFSLRLRMLLALRLVSSLLQLSQTRWLGHAWSKETVYFLLRPTSEEAKPSVDFSRAFVSAPIDGPEPGAAAHGMDTEPKVVLLELGILLLEIWHQTTLEARFHLDEAPTGYYLRLARAVEWLEDSDNPPPYLYETAASYCIRGMLGAEARLTSWDANEFWNGVCKDIIEPLLKNCKQWR
ncbi:hypothetical protein DL768_000189 [Monosporascus sp. mg162]|nr:hypothetical protein DL768_000189 [Monosporascus sp. mg162]